MCLPPWKGHFNQKTDGKTSFEFVVLLLLHLHEIVSLKPCITETSDTGDKRVLQTKQKNTAAEWSVLPISEISVVVVQEEESRARDG